MKNDSQVSLSHKKSCDYCQLISKPPFLLHEPVVITEAIAEPHARLLANLACS